MNALSRLRNTLFPSLLFLLLNGCCEFGRVNERLREAQLDAVAASPYKSAQGFSGWVSKQADVRASIYPRLLRNRLRRYDAAKDTLLLLETFGDAACLFCPATNVQLLYGDTVYTLQHTGSRWNATDFTLQATRFEPLSTDRDYRLHYDALMEVAEKLRARESWRAMPLRFGSDGCNDGSHELFSVLYPDGRIEALYVRCWMPRMYRNL